MQHFSVELQLRIDWSDLDLFGHVNNVAFLKYIQAARVHYWEQIGLYSFFLQNKQGPMLASTNCEYKKPLFYPGEISIRTAMEFIKNTSFSLKHEIIAQDGESAALGQDVMVMFDFNKNEKMPFPEHLRLAVEKLEGRKF